MIDEQKLTEWRHAYAEDPAAMVSEVPEMLESLERLLALKRAADPFITFSHDPVFWAKQGQTAYETLKEALERCNAEPQRLAGVSRFEVLE